MRIFKYAIFYTFIGIYQTGLFIKSSAFKFKNIFSNTISQSRSKVAATSRPQRMRGALLKTAFRSIL